MTKHQNWQKRTDCMYTHDHRYVVISAHPVQGMWVIQRTDANDRTLLKTTNTKAQAQRWMSTYVRSHPNG